MIVNKYLGNSTFSGAHYGYRRTQYIHNSIIVYLLSVVPGSFDGNLSKLILGHVVCVIQCSLSVRRFPFCGIHPDLFVYVKHLALRASYKEH